MEVKRISKRNLGRDDRSAFTVMNIEFHLQWSPKAFLKLCIEETNYLSHRND